ncbi:MAG: hypothetical protein Q9M12_04490 [Mariprofundus sp.]|nr:hypothetical protein [Mariprofundus sp.]
MTTDICRYMPKRMQMLVLALLLVPMMSMNVNAGIVAGSFVYVQESDGGLIQYHVDAVDYQGIPAWRISWDCKQIKAEHFIRRSDGSPLYVKRINHAMQRTVEINYSMNDKQPNIYRKQSKDEYLERKIWDKGLRDLGSMPQLLQGFFSSDSDQDITFSAINYDDGKVYPLIASQTGFRNVTVEGERVHCAIYDIKLDSWLSTFVGKTRLLIPQNTQSSNFVAYTGPSLDGGSGQWSLRLIGRDKVMAMLEKTALTQ